MTTEDAKMRSDGREDGHVQVGTQVAQGSHQGFCVEDACVGREDGWCGPDMRFPSPYKRLVHELQADGAVGAPTLEQVFQSGRIAGGRGDNELAAARVRDPVAVTEVIQPGSARDRQT